MKAFTCPSSTGTSLDGLEAPGPKTFQSLFVSPMGSDFCFLGMVSGRGNRLLGLALERCPLDRFMATSFDQQFGDSLATAGQVDQISQDWLALSLRHQPGSDG